uniref:BZIP domain-containing protein n=1 Tax=Heterorhabditis bacteriophora TaxID=37862 RepID=A0A1I7XLF4_HETBA
MKNDLFFLQPNDVNDPLSSVYLSRAEPNNNDIPSAQVSSSRCDSDATVSSSPHRHNVIVKNDSKRKKVSRAANVIIQVSIRELVKDNAYWERRRKNNDAAKRSRDTRRQKEDDMASRAASLEHENLRLRVELEQLRAETEHLRTIMLSPVIKTPIALRQPVIPSQPFLGLPLIAAPSVIKPTESYCNQSLPMPYPDSTQRGTVLVTNLSNS